MESNYETLVNRAIELGATGAKLIQTDQVVFDPRSYLKCRFGCNRWGKYWTCPPNMDISPKEEATAITVQYIACESLKLVFVQILAYIYRSHSGVDIIIDHLMILFAVT